MITYSFPGKVVLVTGSSRGIGAGVLSAFARAGATCVLHFWDDPDGANRKDADALAAELRQLESKPTVHVLAADVRDAAQVEALMKQVKDTCGGLDVLVNNAGIGATGHFMDSEPEVLRQIFETNFFALTETTRVVLPRLKQGRTPAIVNISSVVGKRALPARSLYSASKFAVMGFSEAIRAELAKDGIDVLVVSPGLTQTNFSKNKLEQKARMQMDHMRGMTSEEVASATLRAIERGSLDTTLTFKGKLLVLVNRFAPWVVDFFSKKKVRELFADEIAERKKKQAEAATK